MIKLLVILMLLPISIWSQTATWREVNLDAPIEVLHLQADTLGFLWLNDAHALYRFDGAEVVEKLMLLEEEITSLEYQSDQLLMGTSLGRLLVYNPYDASQRVLYEADDSLAVTDIFYIDDEHFILASYGAGVRVMHQGQETKMNVQSGLVSDEIYDIVLYEEAYYLATDQGIQILNPNNLGHLDRKLTMSDGLADMVATHFVLHESKLWYTDYDGHLGFVDKNHKIQNFPFESQAKINGLLTHEESIYIATDNGLLRFEEGRFSTAYPPTGIDKVTVLEKDEEGNLWFVVSDQQLLKGSLYFQKMTTNFSDIRTFSMINEAFIIGNQNGLYTFLDQNSTQINTKNITHLIKADDYLLVGTFSQGVMVYNKKLELVDHVENWSGIKNQSVLNIYFHKEHIYISSLSGVMQFAFNNGNLAPQKSLNSVIGPGYIYTMLGNGNRMYFGTDRKGLIEWQASDDKIINYEKFESGKKIGSVFAMIFDAEGRLWFTSDEEELGYLENGKIHEFKTHKRNPSDDYTSLARLSNGNLLAIRGSSVDLVDPISKQIRNFDKELGIENEVSFLNTVLQDKEQTYFVHDHKIYKYNPKSKVKIHPEVIIDEILANLSVKTGVHQFAENENNIEFNYCGSWLTDPSKLTYQYMLEGFDDNWRPTKDNSVALRQLPSGKYKFKVRASENHLFSNEPEATYSFEIRKHIYNRWWVRGIGLIFLGILGWQLVKIRESRKKEKLALEKLNIENQFINLKNQLNPHFLFNAFNTLIGLIEEDSDRSVEFVERMTDFYRNMLENGKQDLITLSQEKEMLSQYIDILKARFNGQLDIQLDIEDHPEDFEIPPMTLQLLLENAVKHNVVSTKNPLQVTIKQVSNTVTVRNRKIALVRKSNGTNTGLKNIEHRFELINIPAPVIKDTVDYFEVIVKLKTASE